MKREIMQSGYDCAVMAKKWGVTRAKMYYYVHRLGLHMRPKLQYETDSHLLILAAECKSASEFTRKHGISRGKLKSVFEERGLPWPFSKVRTLRNLDRSVAQRLYLQAGFNWKTVANQLGVCYSTMMVYRRENGLLSVRGTTKYPWTKKLLEYLYVQLGHGSRVISKVLQRHWGTDGPTDVGVLHALRRFGITIRKWDRVKAMGKFNAGKYPTRRGERGRVLPQPLPDIPAKVLDELTDEAWLAEPEGNK